MEFEQKIPVSIEDEMKNSYIDYAMSVIVGRALPDVRDGLKPVHRRVLYTMHVSGNFPNRAYRKSARIVGDVMGNYHPHGDSAIYDTIVRMAQQFSMRHMLVDGQGNFGSIDGDPAAAYRYTEVKMSKISSELLADIDKETVDWVPNYDESKFEPVVLPSKVPNLLMNGSEGIAVGMATKIPPHNLRELIDALIALIDNPAMEVGDLLQHVTGPDFPTGGFIYGRQGIINAYKTGRGKVIMRGKIGTEQRKNNRESIIVSELPYQVNKAKLIQDIAGLVRDKRITGISDLRDESDKDGIRIVMELKRDEIAGVIINQLFKMTYLQSTFGIIMLTLVDGQPKILNLKEILECFISFRKEVVTRRCIFELKKAEARAHILEGLKIALDNLDEVVKLIRASKTPPEARDGLMAQFSLSPLQAQAILEMRLQRLTGLERDKIDAEYNELIIEINRLKEILANEPLLLKIILDELADIKERFGDDRRTEIIDDDSEINIEDMITKEEMVVTVSHQGYIKRNPLSLYRAQRRGGKGKIGMETKEEDFVSQLFVANTHTYFLFFSTKGRVYWLKCYQIPQAGRTARGKPVINLLNLQDRDEGIATILPVADFEPGKNIVFATQNGIIKKTDLMAYARPRSTGIIAIKLQENDKLIGAQVSDGTHDIFLGTQSGKSIRFNDDQVRKMGRSATGVKGISAADSDHVISLELLSDDATLLTVTENGYGKRTAVSEYRAQGRGGQGVITIKTNERNGIVVGSMQAGDEDELMLVTQNGMIIRLPVKGISVIGRNTQGVRLFHLHEGDKVVAVARLAEAALADIGQNGDDPENGDLPDGETDDAPELTAEQSQNDGDNAGEPDENEDDNEDE